MKKLFSILYSTRLMGMLFILFATAMGVATFIENDYGTQTSKALVYNTWWFEFIMLFFVINFSGNIFKYRLYRRKKWSVLLFHLSFVFIIIGAGITRYIGYEGVMIVGEGESTNKFLSETTYLNLIVDNNKEQTSIHKPLLLSAWGSNNFSFNGNFRNQPFTVKLTNYIPWAEEKITPDKNGNEFLFLVESSGGSRHEHYIKKGTLQNIHGVLVGFDAPKNQSTINFIEKNDSLKIKSIVAGTWLRMADQKRGKIVKDSLQNFQYLTLHNLAGLQFVIPRPAEKGTLTTIRGKKDKTKLDVSVFEITTKGQTKKVSLTGGQYNTKNSKEISLGGLNFRMLYGAKVLKTPFKIKLNDFQLKKYPGSESAASYASKITVIAPKETFDYKIFMNHILNYDGYKFFQSSYDLSGDVEKTHLSVNHDRWGTRVTYLGYFLLFFGLIATLFLKSTRFGSLRKSLQKIKKKKAMLSLFLFFTVGWIAAQHADNQHHNLSDQQMDSLLKTTIVGVKHADKFSHLVIQDAGGRMKPAHTFASELVRKVAKQEVFRGMQPSQVLLSIIQMPKLWFEVPFIYLEKGNTQIRTLLGVPEKTTHARLSDFITSTGLYKIKNQVDQAQKSNVKNKFQKDLLKIDKRVGLLYRAIGGGILRIYPIPNDKNNKWVSQPETLHAGFKGKDSLFVRKSLPVYLRLLQEAEKLNDYTQADKVLLGIKKFQQKFGASVYPSAKKIQLEILYNTLNPFEKLAGYYGYASILMIFFVMLQIFSSKKWLGYTVKWLTAVIVLLFIGHSLGLGMRWYISGNAPWSNAYESIIYVAWATMFFGLIFGRKSSLTLAATTFLTAIILFFAHQNWLDPAIENLEPVLNSYWLLIHVSIIVASYGPFSLGMILGLFSLFLMIFTTEKNKKKLELNIKELTIITEMALMVGLVMITVGNFLGGMWANESWGRYWGWDPKETWALVSIMVYAFVLHMRLIPKLRGTYVFNVMAVVAYAAIMMTYFGVNFYLSGMHSYASGDRVITPKSVYYSVGFVFVVALLARFKYQKYYKVKVAKK